MSREARTGLTADDDHHESLHETDSLLLACYRQRTALQMPGGKKFMTAVLVSIQQLLVSV
jgi:hypothetical protein